MTHQKKPPKHGTGGLTIGEFCTHERHGGFCEKTDTYCNLGACPYEDMKEYAPVVHGRWEHDHYENCAEEFEIVKCSNCGTTVYKIAFYVKSGNYCPNCGAKIERRT